ncbi:MAG: L,D-transpeptidase family protein [Syntrophales bacterium]|jgi:murein L,D-transpeptidase YcbB/YkuD
MTSFLFKILFAILLFSIIPFCDAIAGESDDSVAYECSLRFAATDGFPMIIRGTGIRTDLVAIRQFYASRFFKPIWIKDGHTLQKVQELLDGIRHAEADGLHLKDYSRVPQDLQNALMPLQEKEDTVSAANLADLDIILTDKYVSFGYDLLYGRVNMNHYCGSKCLIGRQEGLLEKLEKVQDEAQFPELLQSFHHSDSAYENLKEALARYRHIASQGGWPVLSGEGILKIGSQGERVLILRKRLWLSGDLSVENPELDVDLYDNILAGAVRGFQKRHNLESTGTINMKTRMALNQPIEEDIRRIELNLERWRWFPRDLGDLYIMVNMPDYSLKVVQDEETVMTMKTVIGKPFWHTPSFNGRMTYLEINPVWKIPPSILEEETIPNIRKNHDYIKKKNLKFFRGQGKTFHEISPDKINWARAHPRTFPYQVIQGAGPANPLGRLKFMFPNAYDVYFHDTPTKHLFKKEKRTFSHGCIRIEKPIDLAAFLMERDRQWTRSQLMARINRKKTEQILFKEPVNVYISYFTTWVDDEGVLQVRPDIYGSDHTLEVGLREWEDAGMMTP